MIKQEYLDLLTEFGADANPHSGRSLLDHLIGTHDLLAKWGASEQLCVAGLFHSIYGTAYYAIKSADLSSRPRLAHALGERVEQLVYLFCVCDRQAFFDQANAAAPVLQDNACDKMRSCEPDMIKDLIELTIANEIEQLPDDLVMSDSHRAFYRDLLHKGGALMSMEARAALSGIAAPPMLHASSARRA